MKMKGTKILTVLVAISLLFSMAYGLIQSKVYAADGEIYVGVYERIGGEDGPAYGIGNPDDSDGEYIWDLVSFTNSDYNTLLENQKDLYCVKGGIGFGGASANPVNYDGKTYNANANLRTKTGKDTIEGLYNDYNDRYSFYSNYSSILCLLDNMYLAKTYEPSNTDSQEKREELEQLKNAARTRLLELAGIDSNIKITDEDIEVVQQMAIWYFTNSGDNYHKDDLESAILHYKHSGSSSYIPMEDYRKFDDGEGRVRYQQMSALYDYLIDYASLEENKVKYDLLADEIKLEAPITISGTSFELTDSTDSAYNLVGPITITKNNNRPYTLDFELKNGSDEVISSDNYYFVTKDGTTENEVSDLQTATGNIYIKIAKTYGEEFTVNGKVNFANTDALLWYTNTNQTLQPIIEVTGEPESVPFEFDITPTVEPEIDLALRKFITAVSSDVNGDFTNTEKTTTYSREPVVSDLDKLLDGSATTATYSHSKEPIKVKNGDYIEYTLRIYNEGEIDGYAEEITDYILNDYGLEFVPTHTTNTSYGWTMYDSDGNVTPDVNEAVKVKTDHLSREKDATNNLIKKFDNSRTTLDSRDIKIVFKVNKPETYDYATKLVNIAEISNDAGEDGGDVDDRDSTPGIDEKDYPNNGYNKDLPDGHEDDIDYEPVELYKFDLSLRKFITAISPDASIEESEILTGTNSREPIVTYVDGKLVYTHDKNPVPVEAGSYVLYTIRVYNEGEIDGYAELIKDTFQEGLEFVTDDTTYNGIWTMDSTEERTYTTDYLAFNSTTNAYQQSDSKYNLLKAFNKEGAISNVDPLNPDYKDVQILLRVNENYTSSDALYNRAQIADDSDENGNPVDDIDSIPNEWNEGEDDQDYDPVILETIDLALRKYITAVGTSTTIGDGDTLAETESRTPDIDTTSLTTGTTATYNHRKDPVEVSKGSVVTYTIAAYNEGTVDAYASEIIDYIPEGLEYIPAGTGEGQSAINATNAWEMYKWNEDRSELIKITDLSEASEARVLKTTLLKDQKIAKRYEATVEGKGPYGLNIGSVQVQLKVKDTAEVDKIQTNIAEISEYRFKGNNDENIVVKDIDSTSDSLTDDNTTTTDSLPSDENLPNYNADTTDNYIPGQEDDDDFEKVIVKPRVDLALTKFITAISPDADIAPEEELRNEDGTYTRATKVNTNPLLEGKTDAEYELVKSPLTIANNSYILYNIRVYNEGEVDVYAGEVTDYLPNGIEFVEGVFNTNLGWTLDADGKTVRTSYLKYVAENKGTEKDQILKAFDKTTDHGAAEGLDYKDLPILCKVSSTAQTGVKLINSAEISKYEDKDGTEFKKDIDSESGDLPETDKNKEGKPVGRYDHNGQDDEDYEVVLIKKVDLALTKFITAISSDEKIDEGEYLTKDKTSVDAGTADNPFDRQTKVDTTPLKNGEHDAKYEQIKEPPLNVNRGAYVLYNIRVYNEGQVDVYAGEVTDYLPENLEFVDGDFNKQHGWTADGQTVKTSYLKYVEENKGTDKDQIIKAFDSSNDDGLGSGLHFKDLPILCRVSEKTESGKPLVNIAEVTKYEDENGDPLPNDVDSTPDNVDEKNEDDDDYEQIIVEEFDLSLLKYVSKVIVTEDGKTTTTETHNTGNNATDIIPKVEIHRKKINSTTVKFAYTIRITNEGDIAGYAKEVTDYVPEGLAFYAEDNTNWTVKSDGVIATRALENTLLQPGESADVEVTFRWINGANNLNLKRNTAEISEDYNEKGIPDRDSTPNNKKDGEDDIDIADVLLSIKTGAVRTYILLAGAILIVLASGVILIKKFAM